MPTIDRILVQEVGDTKFYKLKLLNDDGKPLRCPLKGIALASCNPRGWGKGDIPPDADCTDDCVGWHSGCPFCPEGIGNKYK